MVHIYDYYSDMSGYAMLRPYCVVRTMEKPKWKKCPQADTQNYIITNNCCNFF